MSCSPAYEWVIIQSNQGVDHHLHQCKQSDEMVEHSNLTPVRPPDMCSYPDINLNIIARLGGILHLTQQYSG